MIKILQDRIEELEKEIKDCKRCYKDFCNWHEKQKIELKILKEWLKKEEEILQKIENFTQIKLTNLNKLLQELELAEYNNVDLRITYLIWIYKHIKDLKKEIENV